MRGIVLAGGTGSRLRPLTLGTNKHLLQIYNKPMVMYPLETLKNAGITDIMMVVGGDHPSAFMKLLKNGQEYGVEISYAYQTGNGGIAEALGLCRNWAGRDDICVILGDNLIEDNLTEHIKDFHFGCKLFLTEVEDPTEFGVATIDGNKIKKIVEKPKDPETNLAVTGIYMYDFRVFEFIKTLKPSGRGELEITDVNNWYIDKGECEYAMLNGRWLDCGNIEDLAEANVEVYQGKFKMEE